MEAPPDKTVEILKIVVPAVSALLGAVLAGLIAIFTSLWTSRKSHENALEQSKQTMFQKHIIEAYRQCMIIATEGLSRARTDESAKHDLIQLSPWLPREVADEIYELKNLTDRDAIDASYDRLITRLRADIGTE